MSSAPKIHPFQFLTRFTNFVQGVLGLISSTLKCPDRILWLSKILVVVFLARIACIHSFLYSGLSTCVPYLCPYFNTHKQREGEREIHFLPKCSSSLHTTAFVLDFFAPVKTACKTFVVTKLLTLVSKTKKEETYFAAKWRDSHTRAGTTCQTIGQDISTSFIHVWIQTMFSIMSWRSLCTNHSRLAKLTAIICVRSASPWQSGKGLPFSCHLLSASSGFEWKLGIKCPYRYSRSGG